MSIDDDESSSVVFTNFDNHKEACARNNKFYQVNADVDAAFGIKSTNDDNVIHPPKLCQKCMYTVKNCKKRGTVSTTTPVAWTSHKNVGCETCLLDSKIQDSNFFRQTNPGT